LIISLAFFIFSSSHQLKTILSEPNAIEKIAHKARNVAIFVVHLVSFSLNQVSTSKSLQVLTKSVSQSQIQFSKAHITSHQL